MAKKKIPVGSRGGKKPFISMQVPRDHRNTHGRIIMFAARNACSLPEAIALKFADVKIN